MMEYQLGSLKNYEGPGKIAGIFLWSVVRIGPLSGRSELFSRPI